MILYFIAKAFNTIFKNTLFLQQRIRKAILSKMPAFFRIIFIYLQINYMKANDILFYTNRF